jgi:hypothetical protein
VLTLKTTLSEGLRDLRVQAHALQSGIAFASITFPRIGTGTFSRCPPSQA